VSYCWSQSSPRNGAALRATIGVRVVSNCEEFGCRAIGLRDNVRAQDGGNISDCEEFEGRGCVFTSSGSSVWVGSFSGLGSDSKLNSGLAGRGDGESRLRKYGDSGLCSSSRFKPSGDDLSFEWELADEEVEMTSAEAFLNRSKHSSTSTGMSG
jgi:hypothetical protein